MRYYLLTQRQDGDVPGKYYLGEIRKEITKEDFRFYYDSCVRGSKEEAYAKTVAMYKAFAAIALNKIDNFPGKVSDAHSCAVYRIMERETLCTANPGYERLSANDSVNISHNVVESASISREVGQFGNEESDIHGYMVPSSRVLGVYWGDSREREILCNLSEIPAILLKVGERQGRGWRRKWLNDVK